MSQISFNVLGTPAPKGSSRAFVNKKTGRAVVAPSGSEANKAKLRSWDAAVREAARAAVGKVTAPPFVAVPLHVGLVFRLARPAGHWGKGKNAGKLIPSAPLYPLGKPDADKLVRTTLDSMTGTVFDDDARIVVLHVDKVYADPGDEGASVLIRPLTA